MFLNPHWTDVTEGAERAGWKELAGASFSFFFFLLLLELQEKYFISKSYSFGQLEVRTPSRPACRHSREHGNAFRIELAPPKKSLFIFEYISEGPRSCPSEIFRKDLTIWHHSMVEWKAEVQRFPSFRFLPSTGVYEIMLVNDNGGSVQCQ